MKKYQKINIYFVQILTSILVLSICAGLSPWFAAVSEPDPSLVYCPLQNSWVKKGIEADKTVSPLDEICASDRQKEKFLVDAVRRLSNGLIKQDSSRTRELFFSYLVEGRHKAFADVSRQGTLPKSDIAPNKDTGKAGLNLQTIDGDQVSTPAVLADLPPQASLLPRVGFVSRPVHPLEDISRQICPRAPPTPNV